jgi:hypothetical protein
MQDDRTQPSKSPYQPPQVARVSVDPVKEMLQGTCLFDANLCRDTTPRQ